ncbi:IRK-interacting protein isoform X2 [Asparagus officinalis]|uniref:IRK-interacting protein isoform X2 n=1 Tax=Asparagus officinalis TaxID=4686 RepID=UPI00098E0128|nr:IRK-interacting protein isoform X2 [Asparagus officinalis]
MASSEALQAHGHGIQRQDLKVALAKAMELRALHAALVQGSSSSPAAALPRIQPGASPSLSRSSHQLSAEDYPVFTPSYEEDPLPGYHYILPENRSLSESWSGRFEEEPRDNDSTVADTKTLNKYTNNQLSKRSSCTNLFPVLPNAPASDIIKSSSRRTNSNQKNTKNGISTKPSSDTAPVQFHPKQKGAKFSWLFKSKKKPKTEMSPTALESGDMSQIVKAWGVFSIETLKKELLEANENRDAALAEVSEMKSSLGDLQQKLMSLESYCEDLKKALKHAVQGKDTTKRAKSISVVKDNSMPVSQEVMVEGFLQVVSEARLSVKQFCKTLINQIEEADSSLMEKLDLVLQPHQVAISNKYSKGVLYHLESLVNQSLYQDFENCVFQKKGSPRVLDPQQDRLENFSSFVALRSLSWNDVLQKGTKHYCEDFNRFCDQKMNGIVSVLDWSMPWPEQLLQSFFVSAKCIWLLHLLAFSFNPPLVILRVEEDRTFDPLYMEDVLFDRQGGRNPTRVKIMVMPGFYVQDRVLRCKVLCRYRSVP